MPLPAPCKIESIQQGKGLYQLTEAWNGPRFGSDDAKTGAVPCFFVSEGHPERWNLQNTRDFAHRNQGDPPKERQLAAGNALFDTLEKL